jgi:hypothetical protein
VLGYNRGYGLLPIFRPFRALKIVVFHSIGVAHRCDIAALSGLSRSLLNFHSLAVSKCFGVTALKAISKFHCAGSAKSQSRGHGPRQDEMLLSGLKGRN